MPDADLIGLMRTFIAHAKSNCLTLDDMAARLRQMPEDQFKERYRRFLEIAGPVFQAWDNALADERSIDFEDMLNMAAGLLEQGHYESPYELVMTMSAAQPWLWQLLPGPTWVTPFWLASSSAWRCSER